MLNYLCSIFMVISLLAGGDGHTAIKKAVDAVNNTTPANSWNRQFLKNVRLIEEDNVVELNIQNIQRSFPENEKISKGELIKGGIWYIANFVTGYYYSINEEGGEGG